MHKGNRIVVHAAIPAQPDWNDSLEIVFRDAKCTEIWFAYLMTYCAAGLPREYQARVIFPVLTSIQPQPRFLHAQNTSL